MDQVSLSKKIKILYLQSSKCDLDELLLHNFGSLSYSVIVIKNLSEMSDGVIFYKIINQVDKIVFWEPIL